MLPSVPVNGYCVNSPLLNVLSCVNEIFYGINTALMKDTKHVSRESQKPQPLRSHWWEHMLLFFYEPGNPYVYIKLHNFICMYFTHL